VKKIQRDERIETIRSKDDDEKNIMACFIIFLILSVIAPLNAHSQESKDSVPTKKVQADVAANSDNYFIGPEDVLHIFVWREESLTKTVPVRMDGKISLPLWTMFTQPDSHLFNSKTY